MILINGDNGGEDTLITLKTVIISNVQMRICMLLKQTNVCIAQKWSILEIIMKAVMTLD